MFSGLSHVTLHAQSFAACRAVYREQLSLTETAYGRGPDGRLCSLFRVGPTTLELHEDPLAEPARDPVSGAILNSMYDQRAWISHFAFAMSDGYAVHALLAERGLPWSCTPSDQPIGHHLIRRRLLEFEDPAHLLVQFAERIDDEGRPVAGTHPTTPMPYEPWPGGDRMDHLMLNATDMSVKRHFYTKLLGLPASDAHPTRLGQQCDVMLGHCVLELTWQTALTPPLHAGGIRALGLFTADLEGTWASLRARGVSCTEPTTIETLPGLRRRIVAFRDPDGLPLQAVQSN